MIHAVHNEKLVGAGVFLELTHGIDHAHFCHGEALRPVHVVGIAFGDGNTHYLVTVNTLPVKFGGFHLVGGNPRIITAD